MVLALAPFFRFKLRKIHGVTSSAGVRKHHIIGNFGE